MSAGRILRSLLDGESLVMAPGAADTLTARLVEQAGFPAVYMTGFGATASRIGCPDVGLLTQTEMTAHARDMVRAVSVPVIADADTGYGGPANIERTVKEYQQAGVAAIHLEDQVAPKRCGHMAEDVVRFSRFAPEGERGMDIYARAAQYGRLPKREYLRQANENTLLALQIEGTEGLRNLDAILAVAGSDVIFVGPYDLSRMRERGGR